MNLGSRLESITKHYGVDFIVNETTAKEATHYAYRELDKVRVKGKTWRKFLDSDMVFDDASNLAHLWTYWNTALGTTAAACSASDTALGAPTQPWTVSRSISGTKSRTITGPISRTFSRSISWTHSRTNTRAYSRTYSWTYSRTDFWTHSWTNT